jgi:hypothetical protein
MLSVMWRRNFTTALDNATSTSTFCPSFSRATRRIHIPLAALKTAKAKLYPGVLGENGNPGITLVAAMSLGQPDDQPSSSRASVLQLVMRPCALMVRTALRTDGHATCGAAMRSEFSIVISYYFYR